MELLAGCGSRREKLLSVDGDFSWRRRVTLDLVPSHRPDVVARLGPGGGLPFRDDSLDEIHLYEVLEHIGTQGDAEGFFAEFHDYWRALRPGGLLMATVPAWNSQWAWGDPSHRRVITAGTLTFLSQAEYARQVGASPMSDLRHLWRGDFDAVGAQDSGGSFQFVLSAVKPARLRGA